MRNGVDLQLFCMKNKESCRNAYGLQRTTLLSVGHLIERKGHSLVIDSLLNLPDVDLLIAGDGEDEAQLKAQVVSQQLEGRVSFLGPLSQQQLVEVYNAVDILVLASSREGWANVLLESMACGTPVVATKLWGTPEVVRVPEAGVLIDKRTGPAIADGVGNLLENYPSRERTREYAEQFSWDQTIAEIKDLLDKVNE